MSETITTLTNCQDPLDQAMPMEQALTLILDDLKPIEEYRCLPLRQALGRYLAGPVISPIDVPAYRNSAMDGYALAGSQLPREGVARLKVVGRVLAGAPYHGELQPGECLRIMTGAKMPECCDTVIMQEQVERDGEWIRIDARHKPGQNVRQAGEDIACGSELLASGDRIGPAELGLLASLGIAEVKVRRRPRVAFFSSGDEIRSIGEALEEGQIYDSNRYTLTGMLERLGAEAIDLGVVPDREETIRETLERAAGEADLVLTSGGVSVGEADFIASSLQELGEVLFSKVAIKPGRPLTFGRMGKGHFFGLPGNPVAVMITFLMFVRPAIKRLLGVHHAQATALSLVCQDRLRKNPGRTEFQRGCFIRQTDGSLTVASAGRQGSGVLSSMSRADCLILLERDRGDVQPGESVQVLPLDLLYD